MEWIKIAFTGKLLEILEEVSSFIVNEVNKLTNETFIKPMSLNMSPQLLYCNSQWFYILILLYFLISIFKM